MLHKRVVLKLSGEALGKDGWLFDHEKIDQVASVLCKVAEKGIELAVVIGGGNIWRGRKGAASGMDAVTADMMGMQATIINCLCMQDAVIRAGKKARVFSALDMPKVCDIFKAEKGKKVLAKGEIIFLGGGLGNPFFTTDTAVVLRALELGADTLLLAKNIDGVYDKDPMRFPDAKLLPSISYDEAIRQNLGVMDLSAFTMLKDRNFPCVRVFGLDKPENILKVLMGDTMGTVLKPKV